MALLDALITNQISSCGQTNIPADGVNKCDCIYPDCSEEVAWEQSGSFSLRAQQQESRPSNRQEVRPDGSAGAPAADQSPAAPSTDSCCCCCCLVFLHFLLFFMGLALSQGLFSFFFLSSPRERSFIQFISNHSRNAQLLNPQR